MRARRTLPLIAIAALPATVAGCVQAVIDTDCVDTVDGTYHLDTPAEPPLQLRIDRCRLDVDACPDLCRETLQRNNVPREPTRCRVTFQDPMIEIKVSYEVPTSGDGCPADVAPGGIKRTAPGVSWIFPMDHRRAAPRAFEDIMTGGRTCHA